MTLGSWEAHVLGFACVLFVLGLLWLGHYLTCDNHSRQEDEHHV
ncbi:hypothetical protein [Lentzea guizhouensis]|nr:hypothetical protein [Lentzea guizhouensis]